MRVHRSSAGVLSLFVFCVPAHAWGDEGHEVIGLIADHYLEPAVRYRVQAMLADDGTGLTATDIAHEATWADKYRDSDRNSTGVHYRRTRNWHFVDLEMDDPDLKRACFGRPRLPPVTPASLGPAPACVVDKIEEFSAELASPTTGDEERRLALQFLLHLVGDVHQPLHAGDEHDQGGNRKTASAPGIALNSLHHHWDTEFVVRLGANDVEIARRLLAQMTDAKRTQWSRGTPEAWAMESWSVAKRHAYGLLPKASAPDYYELSEAYVSDATAVTAEQLSKAGIRLAWLLNRALQ